MWNVLKERQRFVNKRLKERNVLTDIKEQNMDISTLI